LVYIISSERGYSDPAGDPSHSDLNSPGSPRIFAAAVGTRNSCRRSQTGHRRATCIKKRFARAPNPLVT